MPPDRAQHLMYRYQRCALLPLARRTMPAVIWDRAHSRVGRVALWEALWLGWATVLTSTFMINHFELFGLRQQVYLALAHVRSIISLFVFKKKTAYGW
ncbi:hypothetical protein ABLN97_01120 [Mycobacterium tuberculosis]